MRAAPQRVRHSSAPNSSLVNKCEYASRLRRRGPRSFRSILKRNLPKRCRTLPGIASGETEALPMSVNSIHNSQQVEQNKDSFSIRKISVRNQNKVQDKLLFFVCNIQCLRAHLVELEFHLNHMRPHVVLLQETWLDASVKEVSITGYVVVSRRDRSENANRGGVLSL